MAKVGDHDYRAYVGRPEEYDLRGSSQFSLMCALGLRENHRLLDVGCGSLRGGRLFITYLEAGRYTGIEPNEWLIQEGIDRHLGRDAIELKAPTFLSNETFDVSGLDPVDFAIAQSIASHTGPEMTRSLFSSIATVLAPTGIAAVTFVPGKSDCTQEGWHYPGVAPYRRETISAWLEQAGLHGTPLAWFHPAQIWWAIARRDAPLPPRLLRMQARGAMLPYRLSWDAPRRAYNKARRRLSSGS